MRERVDVWLVSNGDYWKAVWVDGAGARKSESIGAKAGISRRRARVMCANIADRVRSRLGMAGEAPLLFDWLTSYEEQRTDVKQSTRYTYRDCFVYLRQHFSDNPRIDNITRAGAADWLGAISSGKLTDSLNEAEYRKPAKDRRRKWQKIKLATIRRHVRTAKMVFGEAVKQDRIRINPFDRLNGAPVKIVKNWREVTAGDMKLILGACPNSGWKAFFALCRFGALRRGEAMTLEWPDVNFGANRIAVSEGIDVETTKQRRRICPIEPARCPTGLAALLQEVLGEAPDGALRVCEGVYLNNVRRQSLRILRLSGVGAYAKPFHTLRKCRISELAMQYPQHVVEEWCGHDEEVSRRHYQRVPDELYAAPKASRRIGHGLDTRESKTQSKSSSNPVGGKVRRTAGNRR